MRGAATIALIAAIAPALAGCIGTTNVDDLSVVCEEKTRSPGHPYAPEDLAALADLRESERPLTEQEKAALLTVAADRLLTPGRAPYSAFTAALEPHGGPTWLFQAWGNGTAANASVRDAYVILIDLHGGSAMPRDPVVHAPASLRELAWTAANVTPESAAFATSDAFLGASWDPELPGCVRLSFAPAHVVTVNVHQQRVVHLGAAGA